jgi:hypothetical protein
MNSDSKSSDDRETYLRTMSDRLHDRFLERPAFLDLEFIRLEVKRLDSQIDTFVTAGQGWPVIRNRIGDPVDYADAIFAQRLLSPTVAGQAARPSILVTVLKVLFVVAPVNFIFAIGPLVIAFVVLVSGWLFATAVVIAPLGFIVHFYASVDRSSLPSIGLSEILFLISVFAFGQMIILFMLLISRLIGSLVWSWLGWNLAFLRAEPSA